MAKHPANHQMLAFWLLPSRSSFEIFHLLSIDHNKAFVASRIVSVVVAATITAKERGTTPPMAEDVRRVRRNGSRRTGITGKISATTFEAADRNCNQERTRDQTRRLLNLAKNNLLSFSQSVHLSASSSSNGPGSAILKQQRFGRIGISFYNRLRC